MILYIAKQSGISEKGDFKAIIPVEAVEYAEVFMLNNGDVADLFLHLKSGKSFRVNTMLPENKDVYRQYLDYIEGE